MPIFPYFPSQPIDIDKSIHFNYIIGRPSGGIMKRPFLLFFIPGPVLRTGCKKSDISPDSLLQGVKWILESIRYSDQNVIPIEETFWMQYGT